MRKSWLLCVLSLGTMAWSQAQPEATPSSTTAPPSATAPAATPAQASKPAPEPAKEVPENAVVLTIYGVCPPTAAGTASKTAAAKGSTATTAKKSSDCKTVLTRAEFEKIASGLSPNVTPQLKRQLSTALPRFMAMSEAAKKKGLDKTPQYQETLKVAKMQILTTQLQRDVQEEADKITPTQIEAYYKKQPEAYEQFSLDRIFIPRNKQAEPEKAEDMEKMTEDQKKAKEDADKAKQEQGQQELNKLADSLRDRAAKGEDFAKLQKEAFDAAGMKSEAPTINLPKVRRTGLPPAQSAVFELKPGEVSQVISDNGGHYIYKVVSKDELPLDDQVKTEIHNTLRSTNMKDMMQKYNDSYHVDTNEAYFGPPSAAGPMQMRQGMQPPPRPRGSMSMPMGQPAPRPATAPPAANPPAQQTPPSN
jgi:PPIC-type PPIASE domain